MVAVYVTVSEYVPFGFEVSTLTPYQTVVTSFVAVELVTRKFCGEPLAGIPAHFEVLEPLLVSAEYDASKSLVGAPDVPVAIA